MESRPGFDPNWSDTGGSPRRPATPLKGIMSDLPNFSNLMPFPDAEPGSVGGMASQKGCHFRGSVPCLQNCSWIKRFYAFANLASHLIRSLCDGYTLP